MSARALACLALLLPAVAGAYEPRFDHRDQQGPTAEALLVKDVVWNGSTSTSAGRGAVRLAWGYDPTGEGNELSFGATLSMPGSSGAAGERVRLSFDARYRYSVGTEELKTLFDVGLWGSAADRVAVGPLVGLGLAYDFSRNFGLLTSGFLAAGIGERRIVSFGGGVGVLFRYE